MYFIGMIKIKNISGYIEEKILRVFATSTSLPQYIGEASLPHITSLANPGTEKPVAVYRLKF